MLLDRLRLTPSPVRARLLFMKHLAVPGEGEHVSIREEGSGVTCVMELK